jgi:glyoxylase-like metal-dependent hydrolase (beta-lactamase superfamily II)
VFTELDASPVAVIDTHMHADYLSGARRAAERWGVPYWLHPEDAVSPYDGALGRFAYEPLAEGRRVAFGRATLRVECVPGHTLGRVALVSDDGFALTGDFLFVASVGRPDLGDAAEAWTRLLWRSLERARRTWPGELLVLPAHYAAETERRADRAVVARFDVIRGTNEPVRVPDEPAFLRWIARHHSSPPDAYRTMKLANLGLVTLSDAEVETVEFGPNQCAVG